MFQRDDYTGTIWFNDFWCFNATFNNISAISWQPVFVVEEAGVLGENHRPWASNWFTLSLATACRVHPFLQFTKPGTNPRCTGTINVIVCLCAVLIYHHSDIASWYLCNHPMFRFGGLYPVTPHKTISFQNHQKSIVSMQIKWEKKRQIIPHWAIPKSNIKMVEWGKFDTPSKHDHFLIIIKQIATNIKQ